MARNKKFFMIASSLLDYVAIVTSFVPRLFNRADRWVSVWLSFRRFLLLHIPILSALYKVNFLSHFCGWLRQKREGFPLSHVKADVTVSE
jgi:hypothetical protein